MEGNPAGTSCSVEEEESEDESDEESDEESEEGEDDDDVTIPNMKLLAKVGGGLILGEEIAFALPNK